MKHITKTLTAIGLLCLGMNTAFAATADNKSMSKDSCNTSCTKPKDPCARECNDTQMSMKTGVPPAAYTMGDNCSMFYISADYTYWTARQDGLEVCYGNYYGSAGIATPVRGSVSLPPFKAVSGFKVAIGVDLDHDNWDSMVQYTWFNNMGNSLHDLGVSPNETINMIPVNPLANPALIYAASAKWNNYFNRIDWQLARSFYAGHYLTLRPFLGLVGAWDKQILNVQYLFSVSDTDYSIAKNKQTWWGVGPYAGLDNSFLFYATNCHHFSLFADTGAALTWGQYTTTQTGTTNVTGTGNTTFSTRKTFVTVTPMIESTLGIRWESWWSDNAYMFLLQAGWELQVLFNHNQFVPVTYTSGNFSLQGLTVKALFAF